MDPEEDAIRMCLSVRPITSQASPGRLDWNRLLSIAAQQGVVPFLKDLPARLTNVKIPEHILSEVEETCSAVAARNALYMHAAAPVLDALADARIPVLLLKGMALLHTVYRQTPHLRSMRDVDVLIRKEDIQRTHDVLLRFGYTGKIARRHDYRVATYLGPPIGELADIPDPDLPHIQAIRKKTLDVGTSLPIEVHYGLIDPHRSPFRLIIGEMWARARHLEADGREMIVFSPEDMFLHGALHFSFQKEFVYRPLRQMRDLSEIASQESLRWDRLCELASRYRMERPVYYALRLARDVLNAPVEQSVLLTLQRAMSKWELLLFEQLERDMDFVSYRNPARLYVQTLLLQIPSHVGYDRLRFVGRVLRHPYRYNRSVVKLMPSAYRGHTLGLRHLRLALQLAGQGIGVGSDVFRRYLDQQRPGTE